MNGDLLLESHEGNKTSALVEGQSYFRNKGVEHNVINANDYEYYFIEVELK
jgi:hypothetical protein